MNHLHVLFHVPVYTLFIDAALQDLQKFDEVWQRRKECEDVGYHVLTVGAVLGGDAGALKREKNFSQYMT